MNEDTGHMDTSAFAPSRLARQDALGAPRNETERAGAYVHGEDGRRYLDGVCSAGVFNLGRRPPELAGALREAFHATDQGNFPMVSREKAALAEALAAFAPDALECAVFSVMRGEPIEVACKVARGCTGRTGLVTVDGGWYGETGFALSLSERQDADTCGPLIPGVAKIPYGDPEAADTAIDANTAAVILEPVQAENHCRAAAPAYLEHLEALCKTRGALLVFDETQTNFGRTGKCFAFEASAATPDMLVLGEALGGGMFPIAATLLTQRVNAFLNRHPMIHLSTFGGSDIGCRVASRALELYKQRRPWANAAKMGAVLRARIEGLAEQYPDVVRGVAGAGLLLSLDLGAPEKADAFCRAAAETGLLLLPGKVARHTVLLRPSLLITEAECGAIADALDAACAALQAGGAA